MTTVDKGGEELVREAFQWAADTGGDKAGRTPREEIRKEWELYISDQIDFYYEKHDGLPEEECERMEREMREHAEEVAEEFGVYTLE